MPNAAFTVNNTTQPINSNAFILINTSTIATGAGPLKFDWKFGNGATSNADSLTYTYNTPGNYTIQLIATATTGCADTASTNVSVLETPIAKFSINDTTQCLTNNKFILSNNSSFSTSGLSYLWKFGDDSTSTDLAPTHTYAKPGNYTIKLIVTATNGTKDSANIDVVVYAFIKPNFSVTVVDPCFANNRVKLFITNKNQMQGYTFSWNMGDGNIFNGDSTTYSYKKYGTYSIKLIAKNSYGCEESYETKINILESPIAQFEFDRTLYCLDKDTIELKNLTKFGTNDISYKWYINNSFTSDLREPIISIKSTQSNIIKLISIGSNGCFDSTSQDLRINSSPKANIQINNIINCLSNNEINLTAIDKNNLPNLSYQWDLGEGNKINSKNAIYRYTKPGNYKINLIISNAEGCSDSTSINTSIYPNPEFSVRTNNITQCLNFNEFALNIDSKDNKTDYTWNIGANKTYTGNNLVIKFDTSGIHTINVVGKNSYGCTSTVSKDLTVLENPISNFTIDNQRQCLTNNNFVFTNKSMPADVNNKYTWSFGDGAESYGNNTSHSYTRYGPFEVSLVVQHPNGCRDTSKNSLTVLPSPNAAFQVNTPNQCLKENSFLLTNQSIFPEGTMTYNWIWGDGNTSNLTNPQKIYDKTGKYTIKLYTFGSNGCIDSANKTILVLDKPKPEFSINNISQCLVKNEFIFNNITSGQTKETSFAWFINDSLFNGQLNSRLKLSDTGAYQIKLIANNQGCSDSINKTIFVNENPIAAFTINDSTQCINENLFTLISTSKSSTKIDTYKWIFGNSDTSIGKNINYTYKQSGIYTIIHIPVTDKGCTDTARQSISVFKKPNTDFSINDTIQCVTDNLFEFSNKTIDSSNTNRYTWKFGDGRNAYLVSPKYQYIRPGNYNVELVTYNYWGCRDSIQKSVFVGIQPKAITLDPVYAVVDIDLQLKARDFKNAKYAWSPNTYLNFYSIKDPVFNGQKETKYRIQITTDTGCVVNDTLQVFIFKEINIFMPKAFSPNNDGLNDLIKPSLVGIKEFKYMRIFNRWGNLIYETKDPNRGWDGYYKGVKQQMETYTWIAEGIGVDGKTIKQGGNFIMLR